MIYYYHCYRGAHLSSVAAALHLKILEPTAGVDDILRLEYFDVLQNRDMGVPVLAGYCQGNPVCFVGLGRGSKIFARFADSLTAKMNVSLEYKSVDCLECINLLTRLGGFISRFKRLKPLGRYLAARGVHKNLDKIYALVLHARGS
jgi:hypothetical protein